MHKERNGKGSKLVLSQYQVFNLFEDVLTQLDWMECKSFIFMLKQE